MIDPILLYRSMDAGAALKSITSQSFKVGRIRDFNDTFEWRPGLTGYPPSGEAVARTFIGRYLDRIHNLHGILCFSGTFRQSVLWSHYADKHRGAAFEVEYPNDPGRLLKMEYSDNRPIVDVKQISDNTYLALQLKPLIFRKSTGWSYEDEYRVVARLGECKRVGELYFRPIEEQGENTVLRRVILGFACLLKEESVIRSLRKSGFAQTQVSRAKMCQHSYEIEC
jgi:hypothetical protein